MNGSTRKSIAALTLATVLTASASVALADPPSGTPQEPSRKVRFSDLDLSKPDGAEALYQRIQMSAHLVCTDSSAPWDAERQETYERCYKATVEDAVSRVNRPQLTALHRAKTKPVLVGVND